MSVPPRPSLLPWSWFLGAVVVTLAFLCAWLLLLCFQLRAENAVLRQQQELAALELRAAQNQLEAERILAAHEHAEAPRPSASMPGEATPPPR